MLGSPSHHFGDFLHNSLIEPQFVLSNIFTDEAKVINEFFHLSLESCKLVSAPDAKEVPKGNILLS